MEHRDWGRLREETSSAVWCAVLPIRTRKWWGWLCGTAHEGPGKVGVPGAQGWDWDLDGGNSSEPADALHPASLRPRAPGRSASPAGPRSWAQL